MEFHSNVKHEDAPSFRIENNILIGQEIPIDDKIENIGNLILKTFKSNPDFVGQVDAATNKQSTFRQMRERSVKCALWLKKQDVKPGDIVVICTHNHLETYVPFLATLYVGGIMNAWNDLAVKNSIEYYFTQIVPKVIFVNDEKAAIVREVATKLHISCKIVVFGEMEGFKSLESILNGQFEEAEIDGFFCTKLKSIRDTCAILFSSGSTGLPKGVEIPYTLFANSTYAIKMPAGDVSLWFGSLTWITPVIMTVYYILSRVTTIKISGFDAEKLCGAIEKYKVNFMFLETSTFNFLLKSNVLTKYNVSSLKRIVTTGSLLRRQTHESLLSLLPNVFIVLLYGTTETGFLTYTRKFGKICSNGYVGVNVRLIIADVETGKPLGPNMTGEIQVKNLTMMKGYYNNPEATRNAIDNDGWFHTRDIGYYDEEGNVFVCDRIKEIMKCRGSQVSPAEIENLLHTHPAVLDVAVTSVSNNIDFQHPIAFIKKVPGAEVTEEELKQLVEESLEDCKKLRGGLVFIDEIPRLASGKIDRMQLRKLAEIYRKE